MRQSRQPPKVQPTLIKAAASLHSSRARPLHRHPSVHTRYRDSLLTIQRRQGNAAAARYRASLIVAQPTPMVAQRFFKKIWKGVKKIGKGIGNIAKTVAGAVVGGVTAVGEAVVSGAKTVGKAVVSGAKSGFRLVVARLRDMINRAGRVVQTLLRALPVALTLGVLASLPWVLQAAIGIVQVVRKGGLRGFGRWLLSKIKAGASWAGELLIRSFDLLGGPELVQLALRLLSGVTTPLLPAEIAAASGVLGPSAISWDRVRIAQGGLLEIIFLLNKQRAFTTFHTIQMPIQQRSDLGLMVHELTHVYQFERVGSIYMIGALHAQITKGDDAYVYTLRKNQDVDEALGQHRRVGHTMRYFNREQQAQIAQDFYERRRSGQSVIHFQPYINELRQGEI